MSANAIAVVFFDIGDTLGKLDPASGKFLAYPGSRALLRAVREQLRARVGVITTLRDLTNAKGHELLRDAGLDDLVDPACFVSEHDNGEVAKPEPSIYRQAAARAGVPVGSCLFVGESLVEVMGAMTAGMKGLLKPSPPGP